MSAMHKTLALLAVTLLGACAPEPDAVDQVQTNLVEKSMFEGEWWYSSTVIDVDFDTAQVFSSANALAPFEGSMTTDYGLDFNRAGPNVIGTPQYSFPIARIRWVIDEDFLFAFRSFELVQGGNDDGRAADFRGQPLAVFAIEDHVDIRQDYNPVTGEEANVRVENTSDRRWYERQFMRVDWSENLISEFAANSVEANELFTTFQRESTPFFIQDGVEGYPASYAPQFVRVSEESDYRFAEEWPEELSDKVHYMSFVTQETWSPGAGCLQGAGVCSSAAVTMRNAFLRVPPEHEYAVGTMSHTEFDRFGIFRSHQPTYARGGQDKATQRIFCQSDSDCGPGGACDSDENICVGGLTEDRGETDFLSFYMSRQNLYADSLTDEECVSDWECDARYLTCEEIDDDQERLECERELLDKHGSRCDPAARRCTIPVRKRELRPVEYKLTAGFPRHLVRQTFEAAAEWNEALMRGLRAATGRQPIDRIECVPGEWAEELEGETGDAPPCICGSDDEVAGICGADAAPPDPVECQDDNPADYCFCGSPEDNGGACRRVYDPFESPDEARERGVLNPYDCYVAGPGDVSRPESYDDYEADAYDYRFVGDECVLTVTANSCDLDADEPCEELGDLRHQFLAHIQHGSVGFGGVAQPLSDPTSGELVVSNASVAAETLEQVGTLASQFFPVLRGDESEEEYFSGENLRGYYARLGYVEHPVSVAPSGDDGYEVDDNSRPAGTAVDIFADLDDRMHEIAPKLEQLRGQEGRSAILSDRIRELRGSEAEARLSAVLSADTDPSDSANDSEPRSLIEQSPLDDVLLERQRRQALAARNMDSFEQKLFNSQYWQYWADAFDEDRFSRAEAALRMQQRFFKGVMSHEIGHALGLRHNFAASLDRDNYHDAYFRIARDNPLPSFLDYDSAENGGDQDSDVEGVEAQRWARDLRDVRERRLELGAGNVMTSSVMDYDGDLSGLAGMGRYDAAAIGFSYFDRVEAYESAAPDLLPGQTRAEDEEEEAQSLQGLEHADQYRRASWTYYRGGETCQSNADCPYAAGRDSVLLYEYENNDNELVPRYQPVTQRCVNNARTPNTTGDCGDGGCICSNFDDDFEAYTQALAYRSRSEPARFSPVEYRYCHDNRTVDLSWCTPGDAGESFLEVIDHYRLAWVHSYPQTYFRNFRRGQPRRAFSQTTVVDAVKIYQHLFFRANFEGDTFLDSLGPLGYLDQLFASADALNWLAQIVGMPDVGSYAYDEDENVYRKISDRLGASGSDADLAPGQGFHLWSQYQEGLNGFSRLERAGTFLDKLLAIEALARRDWGLSFTIDERYFINFYDLFDTEVVDLFGGLILRNPSAYAPRLTFDDEDEPVLSYLSLYRLGDRGSNASTYPDPAVDGTDSEALRDAAAIQALATFPIFYDTSFEQRLLVFKTGSGDGYDIPEVRGNGEATCGHGDEGCEAPDYIVYESDRLHTSYVAVVVQPNLETGIDEQQLGFQLLLKLKQTQQEIRALEAQDDLSSADERALGQLRQDLERDESFVEYLIDLERLFGISNYLF